MEDLNKDDPELRDGLWVKCPDCKKESRLLYNEYRRSEKGESTTLHIAACISGGIYSVSFRCPHCDNEEDLMLL